MYSRRWVGMAAGLATSFLLANAAFGQQCRQPPSQVAVNFLQEFERAPRQEVLRSVYDRYVSRERRFTFQQLNELKGEVVRRFGARPEGTFRGAEVLGDKPFSAGGTRGAEVALLASYPQGRVMQVTQLVCEADSWKVYGFEFRPTGR
jgi:hypothetical protein